jgi:hypothetical protein
MQEQKIIDGLVFSKVLEYLRKVSLIKGIKQAFIHSQFDEILFGGAGLDFEQLKKPATNNITGVVFEALITIDNNIEPEKQTPDTCELKTFVSPLLFKKSDNILNVN